jgi:hypothetical protein
MRCRLTGWSSAGTPRAKTTYAKVPSRCGSVPLRRRWMVGDTPATAGSVRRVPHLRQRREEKKPPLLEAARGARPRPPQAEAGALG